MNPEIETRLHRPPRDLTHFMAQEMLYDYISHNLDSDRKLALENYIQNHPEIRHEIKLIEEAERYASHLSQTRISPKHIDELLEMKSMTEKVFLQLRWRNWPEFLKWSTEALTISVLIAGVAILLPWSKLDVLRKLNLKSPPANEAQSTQIIIADRGEQSAADVVDDKSVKVAKTNNQVSNSQGLAKSEQKAPLESKPGATPSTQVENSKTETKSNVASAVQETTKISPPAATVVVNAKDAKSDKGSKAAVMGILYRVMMDLSDSNAKSREIREKIISLGGEKAGQVELGWRKTNPNGNYFHFTMPESNYQQFLSVLQAYGEVRIYKNPHERVMPEGQMRIILWVEDKANGSEEKQN